MLMDNLGPRQQDGLEGPKMLCCSAFMEGYCSKTTCPKAHPGIRDNAEVNQVRLPGRVKKVSYVTVCPLYNGDALTGCPEAGNCSRYHIYIRPSTRDIILRIYPKKQGENMKVMPSGATIKGTLQQNKLNGYGVMTHGLLAPHMRVIGSMIGGRAGESTVPPRVLSIVGVG